MEEEEKKDFSWPRETLGAAACTTAGGGGLHVHYRYQTTNTVANLVKFLPCEEMKGNLVQRAESQRSNTEQEIAR
jgi:hypothetical protein